MERIVEALIEIPMGSQNKYEVDKKTKKIRLDRVLYSAAFYPAEYGFVEGTLSKDGDPMDILVFTTYPTFPGCYIPARIVGGMRMIDSGFEDIKILSVNTGDPRYEQVKTLEDLPPHILLEIKDFFSNIRPCRIRSRPLKAGIQKKKRLNCWIRHTSGIRTHRIKTERTGLSEKTVLFFYLK